MSERMQFISFFKPHLSTIGFRWRLSSGVHPIPHGFTILHLMLHLADKGGRFFIISAAPAMPCHLNPENFHVKIWSRLSMMTSQQDRPFSSMMAGRAAYESGNRRLMFGVTISAARIDNRSWFQLDSLGQSAIFGRLIRVIVGCDLRDGSNATAAFADAWTSKAHVACLPQKHQSRLTHPLRWCPFYCATQTTRMVGYFFWYVF